MDPSSFHIVCAPAGTGLSAAVLKLKSALGSNVIDVDIEKELCKSREVKDAFQDAGISRPIDHEGAWPTMYDITWHLSRSRIKELWNNTVADSLHKFAPPNNEKAAIRLLSGNLVYYGGRRDEFYSVVTAAALLSNESVKPCSVLLLVDDIYDMYLRLTGVKQLYAHGDRVRKHIGRMRNEEKIPPNARLSQRLESYFYSEWELGVMTHLLAWRHLEIVIANNLALQLGAKFMVFGVKHPTATVANLIKNSTAVSVYFSHPVSRPRRTWRDTNQWPELVGQFNHLVKGLVRQPLVCIMPTAIDEYRIARPKKKKSYLPARSLSLDERWPISPFTDQSLLYSKPNSAKDMTHERLLSPKRWDAGRKKLVQGRGNAARGRSDPSTSILLRALERQIQFQISSRDHLLVASTDTLVVFRPFYEEGRFSGGVDAEIDHWGLLAKGEHHRKAIFIHLEEDVKVRACKEKDPAKINLEVKNTTKHIIGDRYGLEARKIDEAMDELESGGPAILDQGAIPPSQIENIRESFPHMQDEARKKVLRRIFTGVEDVLEAQVAILMVRGSVELKESYGIITNFLEAGTLPATNWQRVSDIFFSNLRQNAVRK